MVPVTYPQLRTWHFTETLRTWLKGLDKAAVALIAVAGPGCLAVLVLLLLAVADGLSALSNASTTFTHKFATICSWQLGTLGLLWAMREAVFMPRAAPFFAALPIKASQQLRADIALCMLSYSLLWLPVAWAIGHGFFAAGALQGTQVMLRVSAFVAFSLAANLLLQRLGLRAALVVVPGLLACAVAGANFVGTLCTVAAATVIGLYLWHICQQPHALDTRQSTPNALVERLAVRTGLAVLLFTNELRAALLLRLSCVFGLLALIPLLAALKPDAELEAAGFVVVMTAATIAFHDLPALCRSVAFTKLRFVAGQQLFVRRVTLFAHALPATLYLCALLAAHRITTATHDPTYQLSHLLQSASIFFSTTFVIGTIAASLGYGSVRWLMPVVNFVAAIFLSGFI